MRAPSHQGPSATDAPRIGAAQGHADPERLVASDNGLSRAARDLLMQPPPVIPLDASVAMRVRAAVLSNPGASGPVRHHGPTAPAGQPLAYAKLGGVAGGAALFGAGVMTLLSSYLGSPSGGFGAPNDRSGVVVVSATGAVEGASGNSLPTSVNGQAHLGLASKAAERAATADDEPTSPTRSGKDVPSPTQPSGFEATSADHSVQEGSVAGAMQPSERTQRATDSATTRGGNGVQAAEPSDPSRPPADALEPSRDGPSAQPAMTGVDAEQELTVLSVDDLKSVTDDAFLRQSATDRRALRDSARIMVRPEFRRIASTSQPSSSVHSERVSNRTISSLEEETLLLEQAHSKLGREPTEALALALEHQTRFRRGQLLEQRRLIHLEALLRLGKDDEAIELARSISNALYQERAKALLSKYGI